MPKTVVKDWLAPSVLRWPDEHGGPWEITLRWSVKDERVFCSGITLDNVKGAQEEVTASLTRKLKVGSLIAAARRARFVESHGGLYGVGPEDIDLDPDVAAEWGISTASLVDGASRAAAPWAPPGRPGRRPEYDDDHWRKVAQVYQLAAASQGSPAKAVKVNFQVSGPTATRWIRTSRERGFLPPAILGRAAGGAVPPSVAGKDIRRDRTS